MKNRRKRIYDLLLSILVIALAGCADSQQINNGTDMLKSKELKPLNKALPIIGLMAYEGVLMTEVTAPMDVLTKKDTAGNELFNVIIISETQDPIVTEEGLEITPDYTFENSPTLDVLFVPSAYDMTAQVTNRKIVEFIRSQNSNTDYTVSNCAGAQLIGESGIADGKMIVTWIGGGQQFQLDYPNLIVQNDSLLSYVEDGKFLSSNGNLASYISSLELLEKLTSSQHRQFVESYLYLDRLQNWKK
ncbi:MAG: DJ-1/PfpI family protein [Saprospiraceae bacterium]|nr:DJ-1/PfpI family protein [Saprospiraceae bacterium]